MPTPLLFGSGKGLASTSALSCVCLIAIRKKKNLDNTKGISPLPSTDEGEGF